MVNKDNIPAIRFAGFTDPWEQRKLRELAIFNPKAEIPEVFEYVDLESVVGTEMLSHRTETKGTAPSRAQRVAQIGDLFFQTVRPYQKNNYLFEMPDKYYVFSTGYAQMRPLVDGRFLLCLVQNEEFVQAVLDNCTGTSYPAISSNDLAQIDVNSPQNKQEQKQIGDFFKALDHLITLHQRKYESLMQIKKSMLRKMFPCEGSRYPEVRFAGFTDAWEQRKLGSAATFSKGTGYSKNDLRESGTPIILYGRLYTKYETVINDVDTFVETTPNSVYSTGREVIVPASGETAEDISRASFVAKSGILLGGDLNIITPAEYINPVFLALTISNGNQQKELSKKAQGKSVVHIHNSDLENVVLLYPTYKEQEQIGACFETLDRLITLHQRKYETLQRVKRSLLQKMFV